jgi:hypothetical protein
VEGASIVQVDAGSIMEAAAANLAPSNVQSTAPPGNGKWVEGMAEVAVPATREYVPLDTIEVGIDPRQRLGADIVLLDPTESCTRQGWRNGDRASPMRVANYKKSEFYR